MLVFRYNAFKKLFREKKGVDPPPNWYLLNKASGKSGKGGKKGSLYAAAKFGIRGFAQAIREECASKNIRVSLINPGFVRTPFFDKLGFGPEAGTANAIEPIDIAKVALSIFTTRAGTVIDEINMTPLSQKVKFERAPAVRHRICGC